MSLSPYVSSGLATLAAAIRVMQQCIGLASSPDRHHQGIGDELRCHLCTHRPADHAAREQIDDDSHIEPTFCRPHIGEVGDPLAVGRGRLEGAVEYVRSDGSATCRSPRSGGGRRSLIRFCK